MQKKVYLFHFHIFIIRKYGSETSTKVNVMIEHNYDVIYEPCEKARHLLE